MFRRSSISKYERIIPHERCKIWSNDGKRFEKLNKIFCIICKIRLKWIKISKFQKFPRIYQRHTQREETNNSVFPLWCYEEMKFSFYYLPFLRIAHIRYFCITSFRLIALNAEHFTSIHAYMFFTLENFVLISKKLKRHLDKKKISLKVNICIYSNALKIISQRKEIRECTHIWRIHWGT